jgi:type II secretory pathway pseudopilin PulG
MRAPHFPTPYRHTRRGFTLIELGVSTSIMGVLMISMASVVVIASKAIPSGTTESGAVGYNASALDQILNDLRCATTVTEATSAAVTFTVPDRTGDSTPETLRYAWAGAGSPVTRQYNGAAATSITTALQNFQLSYDRRTLTTNTSTPGTWDSGEVLFSSFNGWSGLLPSTTAYNLSSASWCAEAFPIDKVSFPPDTSKVTITRVSVQARRPTSPAGQTYTVAIHRPTTSTGSLPNTTPLGTPATLNVATLSTSAYAWVDASFSDVTFTDIANTRFVIVVKGSSTSSATIRYLSLTLGLVDSNMFSTTTNSGGSWSSGLDTRDMPFFVYGSYQRPTTVTTSATSYTLARAIVSMQPSASATSRLDSGVEALNKPSIPAP